MLPGIRISRRARKTVVVAYADDITFLMTAPEDMPVIRDFIRCHERATGARLNIKKSKALAVGEWDTNINVIDIPYYPEIKILRFSIKRPLSGQQPAFGRKWRKNTSTSMRSLRQRPMPIPTHSLCTLLPTHKNLAHRRGLSGPKRIHKTAGCGDSLVHMAGCNIPAPHLDATTKEGVGAGV